MYGRTDIRTDEQTDIRTDKRTCGTTSKRTNQWTSKVDGLRDSNSDGQADERMETVDVRKHRGSLLHHVRRRSDRPPVRRPSSVHPFVHHACRPVDRSVIVDRQPVGQQVSPSSTFGRLWFDVKTEGGASFRLVPSVFGGCKPTSIRPPVCSYVRPVSPSSRPPVHRCAGASVRGAAC